MAIRRIGQVFEDLGFITDRQLGLLLDEQQQARGEMLGQIALRMGMITEEQLAQALAEQMGLQVINLNEVVIAPEVLAHISEPMAQLYRIVPVSFKDNVLTIAMADPQRLSVIDELRSFLGYEIRAVVAPEKDITKAMERYYSAVGESVETVIADLESDEDLMKQAAALDKEGPLDLSSAEALAESAPVRKLLNMVLLLAIKDQASDLHFEPFETEFKIRIRADGVLYEMVPPPRHLATAIVTRIKVMANLDIAERRLPQDGRIRLAVGGHPVDLRVSVLPTMFGESVVMRVLDRSVVMLDLEVVGMDPVTLGAFREIIRRPNGIVLVTGPTGSGKTTTLYGALNELNSIEDKLITTEDPVEYEMDGIVQIPIDPSIGNTFAQCLRSILRQDPDIILVGEIRDLETAEIAVQASLTGHMVFSTLHTNDAPSTITRLRDMGIPPFSITATLEAVLAQRLVRKVCQDCREETVPSTELLAELDLTPDDVVDKHFYRGRGCAKCNNTGFKGRSGLFELMPINDALRDAINRGASGEQLRDTALRAGMHPLRTAAMEKVYAGITTIEEAIRETVLDQPFREDRAMPTFQFEAMDATGQEIKDVIEAPSQEEAQATIRQMGYFVTKITVKKSRGGVATQKKGGKKRKTFSLGGVGSKKLTTFTRNLSILQDAGLPILRSLRILEGQEKPGALKNCLIDVCDEIEGGATLSEAMAKSPKAFNRLYVNMIKAGEAGGALETILQRLAEFQERSQDLRRKVKGALIYPVCVVTFAVGILVFIMIKIVPAFQKIFVDFGADLPAMTQVLIKGSYITLNYWYLLPGVPISIWLFIKLVRKFGPGRYGWDLFMLKLPVFGQLIEKNIVARTTRTLGTLVASGVPILEALHITKETSGNAVFENLYGKVHEAIREGESIAAPLKDNSRPGFHPVALFFWFCFIAGPVGVLLYLTKMNSRVIDDMVVNMVDVGEESGELDTMLYKVADYYDAEVKVLTESLTKLMEPLLIIVLGGIVGFIVIALFLPLIALIQKLS